MAVLTITTCPNCGAEMEAFHHTRWKTLESRAGGETEFCPGCNNPLDPERAALQEAAGSGELRKEAVDWLKIIAATSVAVVIVCFTVGFYASGNTLHGLITLILLALFALVLAWQRMFRPEKEPPLVEFELMPRTSRISHGAPSWDTEFAERVPAAVPPPREKKRHEADDERPAASNGKSLAPDEVARRIALAWLDPEGDHPILRHMRVLPDQTTRWPAMRPAETDRKFGTPVAIGNYGTRAYVTVRRDGHGTLSLLQRNGIERVIRFEVKWRKRRA